nr:MAG TPA: virion morphogenesis protein [Caudoviricetes sp.]
MKNFSSLGAFALHLEKLALEAPAVVEHVTDASAAEIQATARGMIGDYQQAVGPYPAWEELADSTKAERSYLGYSENDPGYRSGKMQRSITRSVEGSEAVVGSNDPHLVWFDMGTPTQPPRPVLGPAAIHSEPRVRKIIGTTTFAWLAGRGWLRPRLKSS